ncbi:MAG TPA: nucleotidyltransferase domain-containing protein [Chloroflexota bacterium]|nr:nucleotidyltransferase domain-containing protein [Chloroflexota bacterium]
MARYRTRMPATGIDGVIEEATRRLVEAVHPQKLILFGSYAQGNVDGRSELDLLVILPQVDDAFGEMDRLEQILLSLDLPGDVVVYSADEVRERSHLRGTVLYHALTEGKALSDVACSASGRQRQNLIGERPRLHPDDYVVDLARSAARTRCSSA